MRKLPLLLKIAAGLLGLLVVGAVVGTYALKKYLPPERVRQLITENSRKFLHREVRMKDLDLSALKGLVITGLEVSENPDFKAGTFAKADDFQLRVQIAPLLHGSVAVDRLAVSGFRLNVKKGADGLYNFSDIAGSTAPSAGSTASKGLPLVLDVREFSVDGGEVSYADAGTGDQLTLSDIKAQLADLSLADETKVQLKLKAGGRVAKKPVSASVEFVGSVNAARLNLDKVSVSMKKAVVSTPQGTASLSGTIKGARSPALDLQAEAALPGVTPLTAEVKGALADINSSAPSASLTVKSRVPALKPSDLKALGLPELTLPAADVDTAFELKGDALALKSLRVKTAAAEITASGTVGHALTNPVPALEVSAKADMPGLTTAELAFLRAREIKVPDGLALPAFRVDASLSVAADAATVKSLHFATEGATADVSGAVRALRSGKPVPDLNVSLKASAPKVTPLVVALMKAAKIEAPASLSSRAGTVDTQFHLTADAVDLKSFHLDSQGSTVDAAGRVQGLASGKMQPSLDVDAKLDVPALASVDLVFLKAYKVDVPSDLGLPPAKLAAKLHYTPDDVSVSQFAFHNRFADAAASGAVHKILSHHPQGTVNGSAALHLPALGAKDLAFLKMIPNFSVPASVSWPATEVDASFSYGGADVNLPKLHVKNSILAVDGSGALTKIGSYPTVTIDAKTALPAFASADVAFVPGVPPDLEIPASKIELRRFAASRDAVSFDFLKIESGKNSVEAKGSVKSLKSGVPFFSMAVICPGFVLEELTDFSPQTREMGLKGIGRFKIFVAGEPTKRTASYRGNLEMRGIRLGLLGFKFSDFSAKGDFDDNLIEFAAKDGGIKGNIDEGHLEMDLSVKNYLKRPQIDIQSGTLTALDAGKMLAAKEALKKSNPSGAAAAVRPMGIKIWDSFTVEKVTHPNANIDKLSLKCDLAGITPDLKQVGGTAKFSTAGGHLLDLDKIASQSPLVKVLAIPILIMRGIGVLPNLSDLEVSDIAGDYAIDNGVVDVKDFHLAGNKLSVQTNSGRIDLPGDKVDMDVTVGAGAVLFGHHLAGLRKVICGKISAPSTKCKDGSGLLQQGADVLNNVAQPLKQTGKIIKDLSQ